ncbi:MAG: hypothetical protein ACOC2N_00015 [Spirochaetota bacterium]
MALTRTELETKISNIESALDGLLTHKSYEMDTGQGRRRVTRQDIGALRSLRDDYKNQLEELDHSGVTSVRFVRF